MDFNEFSRQIFQVVKLWAPDIIAYCLESLYQSVHEQYQFVFWQKKESSVLCGALHPTHKFNWKTIAGINCINFAYCMSKKKGKWNQLLYFCRIFFQVSCRVYLAWHVSCSLSWWRIMHQVYLVCLVSVCCSSSRMICFLCLMPNMVHL